MTKLITIKDLNFQYNKNTPLLSNFTLDLEAGHIYGLLGKNGEGKSTLLKLISGLVFAQGGSIDVMGHNPQLRHPDMLQDIYFLPEDLYPTSLSIEKYEQAYAPYYPHFNALQFNQLLTEFEIDSKKASMSKLSHGQKKKVMIAFGLATNTKLLLLDEPTNGLDIPSKVQFRRMVASAMNSDRCLIISTHQVRDLDGLIDNITIMDHHKISFNYTIEEIKKRLTFKLGDRTDTDEAIIYTEETIQGWCQVKENIAGEATKVDIELLFNALMTNKIRIQALFTNTNN
jgi:ABC-2 type transport system ATP-binding protein